MITLHELKRHAAKENIALGSAEKDYALTHLLYGISRLKEKERFIFKGGTALKKVYFPDWRYSEDLDFTVTESYSEDSLTALLERLFSSISGHSGIECTLGSVHMNPGYAMVRVKFLALLRSRNTVKIDLSFNEPVFTRERREILGDYSDKKKSRILVYSLDEILAEKLRSIIERGKSRDYYDVWRLLKFHQDSLEMKRVREIFDKKCEFKGIQPEPGLMFSSWKLRPARDYWSSALAYQVGHLPGFDTVVTELKEMIGSGLKEAKE